MAGPTKREYDQRARAEAAERTRRRILDTVADQLRQAPTEPLSLDKVARSAQVSRSTAYADFGSRAGLFDAFVADLSARNGLSELTAAVTAADAREHLRDAVAAAWLTWPSGRMAAGRRATMSRWTGPPIVSACPNPQASRYEIQNMGNRDGNSPGFRTGRSNPPAMQQCGQHPRGNVDYQKSSADQGNSLRCRLGYSTVRAPRRPGPCPLREHRPPAEDNGAS